MGTRGIMGFVADGVEKVQYNQFDTYPEGLGVAVLSWLRRADLAEAHSQARALRVVAQDAPPTPEEQERLRRYANLTVGTGESSDWYVLLRETQGDPAATLTAGYVEDSRRFAANSLFCEWGYVVDFDHERLEVFRGFQREPHTAGRFAAMDSRRVDYRPIRLIASWPMASLPTSEEFLNALAEKDEGE